MYLYFWSILQNAAKVCLDFTKRKFKFICEQKEARGKCNTGGLCKCTCCRKLPLLLIKQYNRSVCFANITCPFKEAFGIGSMRFSILRYAEELVT